VGENPSSGVYIRSQQKLASYLGIEYQLNALPVQIKEEQLIEVIRKLNYDEKISAIIIQLPLPQGIDAKRITSYLDPDKDAEGIHPQNLGRLLSGNYQILPPTPQAVMELIKSANLNLYGKEAVVVGHSEIVGKPLALMLLNEFVTTTITHIATSERGNLAEHIKRAEILVVAVGKANLVRGEWIKEGAVVVDVGINRLGEKIVGDVEFERAKEKAAYISPVPGGVGPLTVVMLMKNVVEAFKRQRSGGR
jgi:methylenetetrahydrofolate dehydrogenase (NADP+)/methenyltetrahydrofolate cyclohydrolase